MDTSPEYVKMCKAAEEIQRAWKHEERDYIACERKPYYDGSKIQDERYLNSVWLPGQDQLQEMLPKEKWVTSFYKFATGTDGVEGLSLSRANLIHSMEQLWLAFVMKECYNKIWIKEKEGWVCQSQ